MRHLVLIGFMASGKSTLSYSLSKILKLPIFSTDEWIEYQAQKKISDIFSLQGEGAFRLWEQRAYEQILDLHSSYIIDCGGGFMINHTLQALGRVYFLRVDLEEIMRRLNAHECAKRPLADQIQSLYPKRNALYALQASKIIDAQKEKDQIEEILADWRS